NDLDAESGKPPPPGPLPVPARSPPTTARGYLEPRAGVLKGTGKISEIGIAPQDPAAPASGPQRPEQHMGGLQVGGLEALAERLGEVSNPQRYLGDTGQHRRDVNEDAEAAEVLERSRQLDACESGVSTGEVDLSGRATKYSVPEPEPALDGERPPLVDHPCRVVEIATPDMDLRRQPERHGTVDRIRLRPRARDRGPRRRRRAIGAADQPPPPALGAASPGDRVLARNEVPDHTRVGGRDALQPGGIRDPPRPQRRVRREHGGHEPRLRRLDLLRHACDLVAQ